MVQLHSLATRSLMVMALSLFLVGCGTTAQVQVVNVSTEGAANPAALEAAEKGALGNPTVVLFHAEWCNVCRRAEPVVEKLIEQEGGVALVRIDIDDTAARRAVARYEISSTPTFVFLSAKGNVLLAIPGWPGEEIMEMTIQQLRNSGRETATGD